MELDDDLCLCFHVTKRKVCNYLRIERPVRAAELSQCGGAGTGCGWCRPFLERLFLASQDPQGLEELALPDRHSYAQDRFDYRKSPLPPSTG